MKLTEIRDTLLTVMPSAVYHYEAPAKTKAPYIVWAEDSQGDAQHSDNRMTGQAIQGTIDFYTKDEYDWNFTKIQCALSNRQIPYRLNSIQREHDTGLIHYEWVFDIWLS